MSPDDLFALGLTLVLAALAPLWGLMHPAASWPLYASGALWAVAITSAAWMLGRVLVRGITREQLADPALTVSLVAFAVLAGGYAPASEWPTSAVAALAVTGMVGAACCLKAVWWGVEDLLQRRDAATRRP
jgi:NhaP-type Na+/H+ or K+/H+ antiporter